MLLCYTVGLLVLVASILFYTGKAMDYIKGIQAMTEEEKKQINLPGLCKNLSVMFLLVAVLFFIAGYHEAFRTVYLKWGMLAWMGLCCLDLMFIHRSKHYVQPQQPTKRNPSDGSHH